MAEKEKSNQKTISLDDIVSIEEKEGLFRVINSGKSSVILEAINDDKKKNVVDGRFHISMLSKVTIYDNSNQQKKKLGEIFQLIAKLYNEKKVEDINLKDNAGLCKFMKQVLPTYDESKVYPSNIRKIIKWYNILITYFPTTILQYESDENTSSDQSTKE